VETTNIIRQVKSRGMRWAGHVARTGEERNVYRFVMVKCGVLFEVRTEFLNI
jgi:hypothetical protein